MAECGRRDSLQDLAECPICTEVENVPKLLPCGHTMCLDCLSLLPQDSGSSGQVDVSCPLCRRTFEFPETGPAALPNNITVIQLRDSLAKLHSLNPLSEMMLSVGRSVGFVMEIENHTSWPMRNAICHPNGGLVQKPPTDIEPGGRTYMIGHKIKGTATGSYGTVSWCTGNDLRVMVMWSIPYNQNHYSNWLAVGLRKKEDHEKDTASWFNRMYRDRQEGFVRGEFYYKCPLLTYLGGVIKVVGTMGTSHKAEVNIKLLMAEEAAIGSKQDYERSTSLDLSNRFTGVDETPRDG